MADKKRPYRRFGQLIGQATAPMHSSAEPDRGSDIGSLEELSIRLSPRVRQALEQRAADDGTTPSEIVQAALRRYLEVPREFRPGDPPR
jgi:hypothetical protein